jgi:Rod binding domain-containing protein
VIAIQGLPTAHTTALVGLAPTATPTAISHHDGWMSEGESDELMEAARGFEAIFMQFMLQKMRDSVQKGGLFKESFAGSTYEQMHDDQLSQLLTADGNGLGLAKMLYDDITRHRTGQIAYQAAAAARSSDMSVGAIPGQAR